MNLLLDTHSFIWFVEDNEALSSHARTLIEDASNDVYLSIASVRSPGNAPKRYALRSTFLSHHLEEAREQLVGMAVG